MLVLSKIFFLRYNNIELTKILQVHILTKKIYSQVHPRTTYLRLVMYAEPCSYSVKIFFLRYNYIELKKILHVHILTIENGKHVAESIHV